MKKPNFYPTRSYPTRASEPTVYLPTVEAMKRCFAEYLELEVALGDGAEDTLATYWSRSQQYLAWCDERDLSPAMATSHQIKQYRRYLIESRRQQPTTIALTLVVLRHFYQASYQRGLIKANPAVGVKAPRNQRSDRQRLSYLNLDQLRQLLVLVGNQGDLASLRDRFLLGLMALSGPRTVELHRANVGDLSQWSGKWELTLMGKRKERTIPLRADIAELMWQYLEARETGGENLSQASPLLISLSNRYRGSRLSRRGIRYIVDLYLEKAGLKQIDGRKNRSAHSLRHTAGTLGLAGGASLRQVQELLGHSDPKTTAIYAHLLELHESNPALGIDVEL